MVIKVPVPGLEVVVVEVEQLVNVPASKATPIIFASLRWSVGLKGLLGKIG
jgi:hypothetical protein